MKKYIFYGAFLIICSILLAIFKEDKIEIAILVCILYELIEMNNKKEG